jgi:hypothetical protein
MNVAYIPYDNIDKVKWDACIDHAVNGLIYARSFYLDQMAPGWDALVWNDYAAVMPLTWKKKLGIKYLYQPAFIQQGGIFCNTAVTPAVLQAFAEKAFSVFKFAEITFNYANAAIPPMNDLSWSLRTNYVLDLQKTYEVHYGNYDPSFTKSLRRIRKFATAYEKSHDYGTIIQLYRDLYGKRLPYFKAIDFVHFEAICDRLSKEDNVITRVALGAGKQLLAGVVLLKDEKRLYNLISCITPEGRKLETNYYLYDKIIAEFSGEPLLFDFEGSDVKGIADFYRKFNPENQPYPYAQYNDLPPLVKLFKR